MPGDKLDLERALRANRIAAQSLIEHAHLPVEVARAESIAELVGAIALLAAGANQPVSAMVVAIAGLASAAAISSLGLDARAASPKAGAA